MLLPQTVDGFQHRMPLQIGQFGFFSIGVTFFIGSFDLLDDLQIKSLEIGHFAVGETGGEKFRRPISFADFPAPGGLTMTA